MTTPGTDLRRRLGQFCWYLQPLTILAEVVAASAVRAPYSFVDNTISDLGATTCTTIAYPSADVAVCSPLHLVVNGSFVLGGLLLAAGAVLLRPATGPGRLGAVLCGLWLVAGLSTIATGLVPLDQQLELHALVSTPAILLQPIALGLHAARFARLERRRRWWWLVVVAVLALVAALWFFIRLDVVGGGLLERLAIWPVLLALPLLALGRDPRREVG